MLLHLPCCSELDSQDFAAGTAGWVQLCRLQWESCHWFLEVRIYFVTFNIFVVLTNSILCCRTSGCQCNHDSPVPMCRNVYPSGVRVRSYFISPMLICGHLPCDSKCSLRFVNLGMAAMAKMLFSYTTYHKQTWCVENSRRSSCIQCVLYLDFLFTHLEAACLYNNSKELHRRKWVLCFHFYYFISGV